MALLIKLWAMHLGRLLWCDDVILEGVWVLQTIGVDASGSKTKILNQKIDLGT